MATPEQLQTWLDEAVAARHELRIGAAAVTIRQADGRTLQFTPANAARLDAYIEWLQNQIDPATYPARKRTYRVTQTGTGYC